MTTRLYTVEVVVRFAVLAESPGEAESFADAALEHEFDRSPRAVLAASENYMPPDAAWTDDCIVYGPQRDDITFAEAVEMDRAAAAKEHADCPFCTAVLPEAAP